VGDHRTAEGADQRADDGVHPLARVEQLAAIESETRGGRTEGGTELVGAQHQVRWHPGGEQRRGGQQAATAGDGVDETGDKGHDGENGEGGQVDAEFKRHWEGLWLAGRYARVRHLTCRCTQSQMWEGACSHIMVLTLFAWLFVGFQPFQRRAPDADAKEVRRHQRP